MTDRVRNILVGITVLTALTMFGIMAILFTVLPTAFAGGYPLVMYAENNRSISEGDPLYLHGIRVGLVSSVKFKNPADPTAGVRIEARVDDDISLPGNTKVVVFSSALSLSGKSYVALAPEGEYITVDGQVLETIPRDGSVPLTIETRRTNPLPSDVTDRLNTLTDSFEKIGDLAATLDAALGGKQPGDAAPTASAQSGDANTPAAGATADIGGTLRGIAEMVSPENRANFSKALANLAAASAEANEAMVSLRGFAARASTTLDKADAAMESLAATSDSAGEQVRLLSDKFQDSAEKLGQLLATMNQTMTKINSGDGTAGKLLNDPALYKGMVETTDQLVEVLKQFRLLAQQWRQRGVGVKLQ